MPCQKTPKPLPPDPKSIVHPFLKHVSDRPTPIPAKRRELLQQTLRRGNPLQPRHRRTHRPPPLPLLLLRPPENTTPSRTPRTRPRTRLLMLHPIGFDDPDRLVIQILAQFETGAEPFPANVFSGASFKEHAVAFDDGAFTVAVGFVDMDDAEDGVVVVVARQKNVLFRRML
ncbi:hypothetical protein SAICODRAFT_32115, partial [Saitoella complicata NRRL Y-17804]|uniref:uncharacterized protein n=1 Tax=Saitoella complicata (strain BCRC 22490 / CBS 7301 / JCM 7358 / NBRC 10748 / NRRL Y-17804) TaxID=698492 RepID=UPI0008671C7C